MNLGISTNLQADSDFSSWEKTAFCKMAKNHVSVVKSKEPFAHYLVNTIYISLICSKISRGLFRQTFTKYEKICLQQFLGNLEYGVKLEVK